MAIWDDNCFRGCSSSVCIFSCVNCLSLLLWFCAVCLVCASVCVCVKVRGQPQVFFLRHCPVFYFIFWDWVFPWPGAFQTGQSGWPGSSEDLPACASLDLGSEAHATTFGFFLFKRGFWGSNSGPHAVKANIVFSPALIFLFWKLVRLILGKWSIVMVELGCFFFFLFFSFWQGLTR